MALVFSVCAAAAEPEEIPEWLVASPRARAQAGERFQLIVSAPPGAELPDSLSIRLKADLDERLIEVSAEGGPSGERRVYAGVMPATMSGPLEISLAGRSSSVLVVQVAARARDAVETLTGRGEGVLSEAPLSENDPMYFVVGAREGYSARFQLSFKYRLFDQGGGLGRDQPWLSGFYFGYTQNSLWDLSSQSKPFRDTSYRPSLFWKWERTDDKTWLDGFRVGAEHESNGTSGERSRSINTLFVRPEWRWRFSGGERLEFTPKIYAYVDKSDNPDIAQYRGYVDWRVRFDSGNNWIATGIARIGESGKGSLLVDLSRRARDIKFGPIGGYLHFQFFTGYGEDILDYNMRRKSQLRIGFAIVP
jgi:outer membrane phospholipase A